MPTKKPEDTYIISFQKLIGGPEPPFVIKVHASSNIYYRTEYGMLNKAACSTLIFTSKEAAKKHLAKLNK